jgi:hypothetical protein
LEPQPAGWPPPHLPALYSRRLQHVPFADIIPVGQVVVVGVGQFPSLLRGALLAQPVVT